ncbi:MAG: PAS domain S-box protein [Alphaproteobacteria bacterium]
MTEQKSPAVLVGLSIVLAAGIYWFDVSLPLGVAGGVPYVAVILLSAWFPWRYAIVASAGGATVLTILGYLFSQPAGIPWMVFSNRGLALFAIWVTAILLMRRKKAEEALQKTKAEVEEQVVRRTAELSEANAALGREIAEHQRSEAALRESVAFSRGIMASVADGIITIDESGIIGSFNRAAEKIFGYSPQEVCGQSVGVLMTEPDRGKHGEYIGRYLETGRGRIIGIGPREVTALHKDGSTFPLELEVSEMRLDDTRLFIGIVRDITDRKETERQLQQAHKMEAVGQLTGGVAHDFNNILMVALGNLDIMQEISESDPSLRKYLDTALKALHRGADLTQRLLAFSRKQALRPVVTDVNRLVSGTTELMRRTIGEPIEIETVLAGGLWQAMVDRGQLETAVLNLAINARDAMPGGGKLTIETANTRLSQEYAEKHDEVRPGQYVMVAVSDTGTGMVPEVVGRAFDPFFTTKEVGKGSGLGLSMVYGFTKQSGGHIKIYSEVGQGTTVKLYLPKAAAGDLREVEEEGPAVAMPTGDETILVVEDDPDVRAFVSTSLEVLGYHVLEAEDGPAAIRLLAKAPHVDLLFTDVVLPHGVNGRELAEEAHKRHPHMKVLFTSGYTENAVVHHGRLEEEVELVAKPYKREFLARRVRQVLNGAKND